MRRSIWVHTVFKTYRKQKYLLIMVLPAFLLVLVFHYLPIYGVTIAFKDFYAAKGILASPWVGFKHFRIFFQNPYAWRIIRNTLLLGFYSILFGFPAPIILALLVNEVRNGFFRKSFQIISYMPHFISVVIIASIIHPSLSPRTG